MKAKRTIYKLSKGKLPELYQSLPLSITEPIDCIRRRPYWRQAGIIFVHIPKAAGTSISHGIYGRSLGHMKAAMIQQYNSRDFDELFTFSVTRNPWDRAVSAYQFVKQGGTLVKGVKKQVQYENPAFRSFDTFVNEWLAQENVSTLDYVFQPQYSFVLVENTCLDYIGKTENMAGIEKILSDKLNREIKLKVLNRSDRKPNYREFYKSPITREIISKIYDRDIRLFNYDF